ncbi:transcription factor A, mitochondrial-like [Sitodiplosis mosellana]|uniref:transcription factor A, mitochondrial-like n=1 Tax=Sitodiplosis mosellana TaxID=263140 RepID=UPI0024449BE9|nr:transcription factor A, mitochondrial-like [Sitodiplosis mosellana]
MNSLIKCLNRSLILSAERTTHLAPIPRLFSGTNVVFDSKTNVISRKLGIPERPKRPMTGYYRFLKEVRPSIKKTGKTTREIPVVAAAQWNKLDESQKQKYIREYEQERVEYMKKKEEYEKSLTKEQKLAIKDERIRLRELKEDRANKQELRVRLKELGKPKRPSTAYILFYSDEAAKGKVDVKSVKAKYDALNESQKNAYKQKADAASNEYRKALQTWEKRMVAKGLADLINKSTAKKLPKLK